MKNSTLRLLILVLSIVLIVVVTYAIDIWINQNGNTPTEPSTQMSSGILSSPPASTQTTTVPSQVSSGSPVQTSDTSGDYIGNLYTREQLEKMHLGSFYDNVMAVIQAWFYDGVWTPEAEYISEFVFGQGSVSHNEEVANNAIASRARGNAKHGKFRMIIRRLFPARKHLDWNYPKLKKVPLPFAWVARWFSLLGKRDIVQKRLDQMSEITDDSVNAYRQSLEFVGLDIYN